MDRRLLKTTAWTALGTAGLIALLFLFVDRPVDLAAHGLKGSAWYQAAAMVSLLADHQVFNVILFSLFLYLGAAALSRGLTPGQRLALYACLAVAVAMLMGETLKWFFGRYRPEMLFDQGRYGFSFLAHQDSRHSFPSGHNFRIFSALTALSLIWPRSRVWLLSLAAVVGASRVVVTRHYPSDVVAGAFVGIFCALWVWRIMGPRAGVAVDNESP